MDTDGQENLAGNGDELERRSDRGGLVCGKAAGEWTYESCKSYVEISAYATQDSPDGIKAGSEEEGANASLEPRDNQDQLAVVSGAVHGWSHSAVGEG